MFAFLATVSDRIFSCVHSSIACNEFSSIMTGLRSKFGTEPTSYGRTARITARYAVSLPAVSPKPHAASHRSGSTSIHEMINTSMLAFSSRLTQPCSGCPPTRRHTAVQCYSPCDTGRLSVKIPHVASAPAVPAAKRRPFLQNSFAPASPLLPCLVCRCQHLRACYLSGFKSVT